MKEIVSQKIKNARALKGLSQQELADMIGVSKQMISKYEKGESIPSSSNLLKLGKSLKVKIDYFFKPSKIELGVLNFRKKSSFSNKKQKSLEQLIKLNLENYLEIESLLQIDYSFKNFIKNEKVTSIEDIEKIVLTLRNVWEIGLDPIHNIIQLLEDNEIKVIELFDVDDNFDGLATFVNDKFPVIVVNGNFPVERKRFTLLHELGHLLLNIPECNLKDEENYCNKFASEFLFPKKLVIKEFGVKRDLISLNELIEVQRKYGMSIQAIIYRLVDAGIFTENRKIDFYKKINFNPSLKREVNLPRFPTPEKSNRFEQLVYRALSQEIISISKASSLLNQNINLLNENSLL
ncbi:XRE family transcriptional regulator [Flavobacterium sp.]|uniref:helix-turn-helix domain-containing protein n=1 Tax=Flavobacterium sp. TaxID=239 RepID=UPI00261C9890|nr:XRE family transcriptional regulator [Flavobacterium sp.]